jgi:preprotein translocase subunit SecA
MAGRGVDIILGGSSDGQSESEWQKNHNKVIELGGLHIVGTERHEARRIDNQLRGRAGRQGDPGSSRFYVSLEDDVVRRFGGDRFKGLMEWAGMDEDTPIESRLVNRTIEGSQVRVEGYHFDMRKHLVEYDDVINQHREIIYGERRKILKGADLKANTLSMIREEMQDICSEDSIIDIIDSEVKNLVAAHLPANLVSVNPPFDVPKAELEGLIRAVSSKFPPPLWFNENALSQMSQGEIEEKLFDYGKSLYKQWRKDIDRGNEIDSQSLQLVEQLVMPALIKKVSTIFPLLSALDASALSQLKSKEIEARLIETAETVYEEREKEFGSDATRVLERLVMLRIIDSLWVEHLTEMEQMRQGIGLMGMAQRDPLVAYKTQGHEQFQHLLSTIRHDLVHTIYHMRIEKKEALRPAPSPMAQLASGGDTRFKTPMRVKGKKIGRNEPCPCGSGKKYKHCCGR